MNQHPVIQLDELSKVYRVNEREAGLVAAMRSFVKRKTRDVQAVDEISFSVDEGEIVGFLGPNGAGKTTTLKMLSGLLHPTGGRASVLGYRPWERNRDYLRRMTLVMGQRNQLLWDIPVIDTFELNRAVYRIPEAEYRRVVDELTELLDLGPRVAQTYPQPLSGRAHEMRNRGRAPPQPVSAVPGRADHRAGCDHAAAYPPVHNRIQSAHRRHGPADQSLYGRRGGLMQARDRYPSWQTALRWRT